MPKPKIAILAASLVPPHPAGTQILEVIDQLSDEFEFTVFAKEVDAKLMNKVNFIKVPIPLSRPLLLRHTVQYLLYARLFKKLRLIKKYDIVHAIEVSSPYATLTTMHFCTEAAMELMKNGTLKYKGWRKLYYPVMNSFGTIMERKMMSNPYLKDIITVSNGLKKIYLHTILTYLKTR